MDLKYVAYGDSVNVANIVVDGAANESTVLTLSHWPGSLSPSGLARDLSAEMAFAYLDRPCAHAPAHVITNNHFDQDGVVAMHTLLHPERSLEHRELLIDVAAAGDFATYTDRRAARASMVLAAWAEVGWGYAETLPLLVPLAVDPEPYRGLWEAEDEQLSASELAIERGAVVITERPDLDLAIVDIAESDPTRRGHRFAHQTFEGLHPMALHNATSRFRVLILHGTRFQYIDRYETWVQFQSRPTKPRADMGPLADRLNALDAGLRWRCDSARDLSPILRNVGPSSLPRQVVVDLVVDHLVGTDHGGG